MKKLIDLHIHTTASDGVLIPAEVVKKAKKAGLAAIGITDHDCLAGLPEAFAAGRKFGLEIVPGAEISTYWSKQGRREFHVLGYYMDLKNQKIRSTLEFYQKVRQKRAEEIVKKLQEEGWRVSYEKVKELAAGAIGRPHLAQAVIANRENAKKLRGTFGGLPDTGEFIVAYLVKGKPAYVEKAGMEPEETIKLIHQAKGVAVLAHPGWDLKIGEEDVIKQFARWKVDGLEAIHGKETKEDCLKCIDYFSGLARKYGLLITGGSDFHKCSSGGAGLGLLGWGIEIPYELLVRLKA